MPFDPKNHQDPNVFLWAEEIDNLFRFPEKFKAKKLTASQMTCLGKIYCEPNLVEPTRVRYKQLKTQPNTVNRLVYLRLVREVLPDVYIITPLGRRAYLAHYWYANYHGDRKLKSAGQSPRFFWHKNLCPS